MNKKDDNLKKLLSKFYSDAEAARVEEDIMRGEKILADNPAPEPDTGQIRFIKLQVNAALRQREVPERLPRWSWAVAAAAAIAIVSGLLLMQSHKMTRPVERPGIAAVIWDSNDFTVDDEDFAMLTTDVEEAADEVLALGTFENGVDWAGLDEIEIELMEISDDFWKG